MTKVMPLEYAEGLEEATTLQLGPAERQAIDT
jgi:hypothetical protein